MKTRLIALGGLAALLGTTGTFAVLAQTPSTPTTPVYMAERHPELIRALHALNNAADALKSAAHDYHGHRVKALDDTNAAINEVKAAIDSDRH